MRWILILAATLVAAVEPPTIRLPAGERPVHIRSCSVRATVHGLVAEVRTELVFANPNPRALEGTLEFPLPDDATVCGYALDVQGRLVDGVAVGKDQARVVLESESHQGVDPGLAEHVAGNLFRTRIFPVATTRTVAVTWTAPLVVNGNEATLRLPLPQCFLPELSLQVEIAAGPVRPELSGFGNLELTAWEQLFRAASRLTNVAPDEDLLVRLPRLPPGLVLTGTHDGESFAAISQAVPPLSSAAAPERPRRLAVAWDASASRAGGHARSRDLLIELMRRTGCAIDLVVFRDAAEAPQAFHDPAALARHLDALPYDGATALSSLDLRTLPHPEDAWWLVVGDGMATADAGLPATGAALVAAAIDGVVRDAGRLRLIAARTGGGVVDLALLSPAEAAQALLSPPPVLLRVESDALADVQVAPGHGRHAVFARLLRPGAATLVFAAQGRETGRVQLQLPAAAMAGPVLARAWAGARVADLAAMPEENREALIGLGRRFGLVTPVTSLLVLERLDQYLRHRIAPPASWPEMHHGYLAAEKRLEQDRAASARNAQNRLFQEWAERVAWWEGLRKPSPARMQVARLHGGIPGMVPAEAAAAAPAAPATSGAVRDAAANRVELRKAALADAADSKRPAAGIRVARFQPEAPWLQRLRAAAPDDAYATYLRERAEHPDSPSLLLDCGGLLLRIRPDLGRRVLSNLLELRLDDPALLRTCAWRLQEAGDVDAAIAILRRVLRLRPEEPQSYRDLALALAARGEQHGTATHIEEALGLLRRVALRDPLDAASLGERSVLDRAWDRFPGIEVCALEEFNRLADLAGRRAWDGGIAIPELDARLRRNLDCDLRVSLSWDRDATDLDLHVLEPGGEEAYYGRHLTTAGGLVSPDCTQGYGPEEYLMRNGQAGTYQVRCAYFGSRANDLLGPATVTATVFRDWGRPGESRQTMTLRLERTGASLPIGEIDLSPAAVGRSAPPSLPLIRTLRPGMARSEIERRLGPPLRVDGGGLTVLLYRLDDGRTVRIGCGPGLVWAREVQDGAERDLVR